MLVCVTLSLVLSVFAQEKKVDPETAKMIEEAKKKARELADKKTEESEKLIRDLLAEKKAAKTEAEKAAFQKKVENLIKAQQQKLPDLLWQRKKARFKGLYYALLSVSKTKEGKRVLPDSLDSISKKTQLDLSNIHYNGGLETGFKNAKETVVLTERKPDSKGRKITLFLDGHIEITELKNIKNE